MANDPLMGTISGPSNQGPRGGLNALDPNNAASDAGLQNRSSYGGHIGGAREAVDRYQGMGQGAAGRGAYQADYSDFQYGQGQGRSALGLTGDAARGNAPSAAEISGRSAMDQSLANQVAAAGSARGGPAAQAEAYRHAQAAGAANQAQMTAGIQAGRANEMATARGQYLQGSLGYGQNALGQTGQQIQNEQFQRGLNQQGQEFYEGMGAQVNAAQLQANQNAQAMANQQFAGNQGVRQGDEGLSWDKVAKVGAAVGGAAGTGGASLAAAARGGPVGHGQPYLVGEEGPELVIPKHDATVIPAAATASLLGGHTPGHTRAEGGSMEHAEMSGYRQGVEDALMSQDRGYSGERSGPRESREAPPPEKDAAYYAKAQVDRKRASGAYASDPGLYEPIAQPAAKRPNIFEGVEAPDYKPRAPSAQAADTKAAGTSGGSGKAAAALGAVGSKMLDYAAAPPSYRYHYDPNAYGLGQNTHPIYGGPGVQPMAAPSPMQLPARAGGGPIYGYADGGFMPAGGEETGMTGAGYMPGLQYAQQNKALVGFQHHPGSPGGTMMGGPMAFHARALGGPMAAGGGPAQPMGAQPAPAPPPQQNPAGANPYTTPYGGMTGVTAAPPSRLMTPASPPSRFQYGGAIPREEGGEMNAFGLRGHDTREAPIDLSELVDPTPETPKRVLDQRAAGPRGAEVKTPKIATSTGTGHGTPGPTTATSQRPGPATASNKETFPSRRERENRHELAYGAGK